MASLLPPSRKQLCTRQGCTHIGRQRGCGGPAAPALCLRQLLGWNWVPRMAHKSTFYPSRAFSGARCKRPCSPRLSRALELNMRKGAGGGRKQGPRTGCCPNATWHHAQPFVALSRVATSGASEALRNKVTVKVCSEEGRRAAEGSKTVQVSKFLCLPPSASSSSSQKHRAPLQMTPS